MVFLRREFQWEKQQSQWAGCLLKGTDREKILLSSTIPAQPGASFHTTSIARDVGASETRIRNQEDKCPFCKR